MKLKLLVLVLVALSLSTLIFSLSGCGYNDVAQARPGPLEVVVVSDEGRPVGGIKVSVLTAANGLPLSNEVTSVDGIAAWPQGSADAVEVIALDPERRFVEAHAEGLGSGRIRIEMQRGATLRLTVASRDQESIQPSITVWSPDQPRGRHVGAKEAAESQAFEVTPVAAGQVKLLVMATGYVSQALDVRLTRGENDLGSIALEPGGSVLKGRVPSELERKPTSAYFRFNGAGMSVPIDSAGEFVFSGLPLTEGTLVFRRDGRELFARSVDVAQIEVDLGIVSPRR